MPKLVSLENLEYYDNKIKYSIVSNVGAMAQDVVDAIGTSTSQIIAAVNSNPYAESTGMDVNVMSVTANTSTAVPSAVPNGSSRKFIELRAVDESDSFFISFSQTTNRSKLRPVQGSINLTIPSSINLYVFSEEAIEIAVTEGWR